MRYDIPDEQHFTGNGPPRSGTYYPPLPYHIPPTPAPLGPVPGAVAEEPRAETPAPTPAA